MPPEQTPYQPQPQPPYQPPAQQPVDPQPKPEKRSKLPIIVLIVVLVLLATAAAGYYLVRKQTEDKYLSLVTEANTSTIASMAFAETTMNEMATIETTLDELGANGEYDQDTKRQLANFRKEATPLFDKYLQDCTNYKEKYLHSSEVPAESEFPLLSEQKKQHLAEMRTLLSQQEDKDCQNAKATIGIYYYIIDMAEGITNSTLVIDTRTSESDSAAATAALAQYADDSYAPKYNAEMQKAMGKDFDEINKLVNEFFASAHGIGKVGMSNVTMFSPEFSALMTAQQNLTDYGESEVLDDYIEKQSKDILAVNTRHYPVFKAINQEAGVDVKFSEPVYVGAIIHSALSSYTAADEPNLEANNIDEIVTKLKDAELIDNDLPTKGISYKSTYDQNATLTITDPVSGKTYKFDIAA